MKNTYKITKDEFIVSRPWYATVVAANGFEMKTGPFKTKKKAREQIETWKEISE